MTVGTHDLSAMMRLWYDSIWALANYWLKTYFKWQECDVITDDGAHSKILVRLRVKYCLLSRRRVCTFIPIDTASFWLREKRHLCLNMSTTDDKFYLHSLNWLTSEGLLYLQSRRWWRTHWHNEAWVFARSCYKQETLARQQAKTRLS